MKKFLSTILMALLFIACSSPLDKEYHEDTLEQDAGEIRKSEKVSDSEMQLMAGWLVRAKLQGEKLEGKTYAEILKEAKDFNKEQKELADKTKKRRGREKRTDEHSFNRCHV